MIRRNIRYVIGYVYIIMGCLLRLNPPMRYFSWRSNAIPTYLNCILIDTRCIEGLTCLKMMSSPRLFSCTVVDLISNELRSFPTMWLRMTAFRSRGSLFSWRMMDGSTFENASSVGANTVRGPRTNERWLFTSKTDELWWLAYVRPDERKMIVHKQDRWTVMIRGLR